MEGVPAYQALLLEVVAYVANDDPFLLSAVTRPVAPGVIRFETILLRMSTVVVVEVIPIPLDPKAVAFPAPASRIVLKYRFTFWVPALVISMPFTASDPVNTELAAGTVACVRSRL